MEETVSVRIPREGLIEIEKLLKYKKLAKAVLLREILEKGIKEKKLEVALEKFQNGDASALKAAKIAGLPLTSFLDILQKKGISFHYNIEDLREDVEDLL
jgi:predicted HTH domain antitoxin